MTSFLPLFDRLGSVGPAFLCDKSSAIDVEPENK